MVTKIALGIFNSKFKSVTRAHTSRKIGKVSIQRKASFQIVSLHGKDPSVIALLNKVDLAIVPVFNPDGYVYTWTKVRTYFLVNFTLTSICLARLSFPLVGDQTVRLAVNYSVFAAFLAHNAPVFVKF